MPRSHHRVVRIRHRRRRAGAGAATSSNGRWSVRSVARARLPRLWLAGPGRAVKIALLPLAEAKRRCRDAQPEAGDFCRIRARACPGTRRHLPHHAVGRRWIDVSKTSAK